MSQKRPIRVSVFPVAYAACQVCGKDTSKRKGKSPAPICLFAGKRVMVDLCMACAKIISSRLDSGIERIERGYKRAGQGETR